MSLLLHEIELPARLRTERPLSDDEFLRFCAANDPLRVEREASGELLIMTPTGWKTSTINSRIARYLDVWAEADGRGLASDSNGGFALPDGSMRIPDAAWIRLSRCEGLTPSEQNGFLPACPDFVIELRSASDSLPEMQDKMRMWIANGAELAWLIDPERRAVEVYRPGCDPELHENPSSVQGTGIVAGFELVLARIWQ